MSRTRTTLTLATVAATATALLVPLGATAANAAESARTTTCQLPPKGTQANATAERLVTKFFHLIEAKDRSGMSAFLTKGWMAQTSDGTGRDRQLFLDTLPNVQSFSIDKVNARLDGFLLVSRYLSMVQGDINGKPYSSEFAPRLATFSFCSGKWKMVSQGNFDPVIAGR